MFYSDFVIPQESIFSNQTITYITIDPCGMTKVWAGNLNLMTLPEEAGMRMELWHTDNHSPIIFYQSLILAL
jgi:hypothetical protein